MNDLFFIRTHRGQIYFIDSEDASKVKDINFHNWGDGYACGWVRHIKTYLHHLILPKSDGLYVDHINRNKKDNRKCNLRYVSPSASTLNRKVKRGNNKYRGVYWESRRKKWFTKIAFKDRIYYGKVFSNIKEAALEYNMLALTYHGRFANLNKVFCV